MTDHPAAGGQTAGGQAHRQAADLGDVQSTLFIPLTARARETRRGHPALRDPKAVEVLESVDFDAATYAKGWNGWVTVPRTVIYDHWVTEFLGKNPGGTVVELGTGLNTRFERTDNGTVHWIDLDLPDTIELRRRFFADTDRRRMIAASLTSEEWPQAVAEFPAPYFFVAEGVLAYLSADDVAAALTQIATRFPEAFLAFDTCSQRVYDMQHKQAERKGMAARWAWACDDPKTLERYGLRLLETTTFTSPPPAVRRGLPARYRYLLPLAHTVFGKTFALNLFQVA